MKPQVLTMLALRVVAVFIAAKSFVFLAQSAVFLAFPPANAPHLPVSFLAVLWLVGPFFVAIILWWLAPHLARLAARGVADEPVTRISVEALVGATFVAAGTLVFVTALPGLIGNAMRLSGPPGQFVLPMLIGSIVQCSLGVVLVVGSRGLSRLLFRLRYAGTRVPDL